MKSLNFETQLQHEINASTGKRKGERTRDRLKWATASLLNTVGFHGMRLTDISERAGISPAAFYMYFNNKTEITQNVLTDFVNDTLNSFILERPFSTTFAAIVSANMKAIERFSANAGLMRCVWQFSEEVPEFKTFWRETNNTWYQKISESALRRYDKQKPDKETVLLVCHMVGGMMDDLMRDLYINKNPQLVATVEKIAPSHGVLAEFISVIWFRALFGTDPEPNQLTYARSLCELRIKPEGKKPEGKKQRESAPE